MFHVISGFTNAAISGDKLDFSNGEALAPNAVAGTATGVTNLTAQVSTGVITFGGTAAATATLQNKIDGDVLLAGATAKNEIAFEDAGNTYVFVQGNALASYEAGVDNIVQFTGMTGVTALSTTASGVNTIYAS